MKQLGAKLPAGGAALIMLGSTEARDTVIDRVKPSADATTVMDVTLVGAGFGESRADTSGGGVEVLTANSADHAFALTVYGTGS